ncbi:hypothetical protein [Bauldia litoralis]|uniref:hypothetical protein n=1 Tax=Bauldia litoralis TaxID=665467 RepID=UPI003266D586
MNAQSLIAVALTATSVSAAEPVAFNTSRFPDMTTVELTLLANQFSTTIGYDFDVTIGMTELGRDGRASFRDRGRHTARVRCGTPPSVFVGGADYSVGRAASSLETNNWMRDLWRAVCSVPTS